MKCLSDFKTTGEKNVKAPSLFQFINSLVDSLRLQGRQRTAETYEATLSSFRKFRRFQDLPLEELTSDILAQYQAFLYKRGVVPNTVSFYMRILRAVYYNALDSGLGIPGYPFRHVFTGNEKTKKRALPTLWLKKIKNLDLSLFPKMDFARDMFMLSFYLRGMSFIDMAYLRKKDLCNNSIIYRRRKTGRPLQIKWTGEMQQILDKYPTNPTEHLLPILSKETPDKRRDYIRMFHAINRHLKRVGKLIDPHINLTLYVARHSWATLAQRQGIALAVISEALGHDSETTTRVYLSSLDNNSVNRANAKVMAALKI